MTAHPDLLIPATAELLHGWCGPVVFGVRDEPTVARDGAILVGASWLPAAEHLHWLRLNLSRAECRDRVARVLAHRMTGESVGDARPIVYFQWHQPRRTRSDDRRQRMVTIGRGVCWVDREDPAEPIRSTKFGGVVPGLADLDPAYPGERLPDDSRLVDALALALCWRAVAGGAA